MGKKQKTQRVKKNKKREIRVNEKLRIAREKQKRKDKKEKPSLSSKYLNGKMIEKMMIEEKIKGDFKDYVIIFRDKITDYKNSYIIKTSSEERVGTELMVLMHKKKLKNIIGEKAGTRFWHPKLGRIHDIPPATKKSKKE